MPGAVPIVPPLPAPPVPSGGTLVSSATQAGRPPPAVKPVPGPYGSHGLDGLAGQTAHGSLGMRTSGMWGVGAQDLSRVSELNVRGPRDEITEQVRIPGRAGRSTKRSALPLVALAVVAAASVIGALWYGFGGEPAKPSDAAAVPTSPAATSPAGSGAAPERAASPTAEPALGGSSLPGAAEPTVPIDGDGGAEAPSAGAAPAEPRSDDSSQTAKKRSVQAVQPDPRAKPLKSKGRTEPKRPRGQAKEQQPWNDESPFMPVITPKH